MLKIFLSQKKIWSRKQEYLVSYSDHLAGKG
jgi:hypothetical protein